MLVLTRRPGQALAIGAPINPEDAEPAIEVVLVEVRGDQIRIGINAPADVVVDRKEIWLQKQVEKDQV